MSLMSLSPLPAVDVHDKFIFIGIQKTGLHSVWDALDGRIIRKGPKLKSYSENDILEKFKFTIVRNPWDRMISAFFALKRKKNIKDFNQFLEDKLYLSKNLLGPDIMQHPRIVYADFIARLENIEKDWDFICEKIECKNKLKKLNATKHDHYSAYYNDESKEIVGKIFEKDIEILGYEFV